MMRKTHAHHDSTPQSFTLSGPIIEFQVPRNQLYRNIQCKFIGMLEMRKALYRTESDICMLLSVCR